MSARLRVPLIVVRLGSALMCAIAAPLAAMPARDAQFQFCGGDDDLAAANSSNLGFSREFSARGRIEGGLAASARDAGVPAAALAEALDALRTRLDLDKDIQDGDRFYVRWQETFGRNDIPTDQSRVLTFEITSAMTSAMTGAKKVTHAISLFRPFAGPAAGVERFFFSDGTLAGPPPIRLPLDDIKVTSGFGLRPDPLDQPTRVEPVVVQPPPVAAEPAPPPPRTAQDLREVARAYAGFGNGEQLGSAREINTGGGPGYGGVSRSQELDRVMAERRIRQREEQARLKAEAEADAQRKEAERQREQRAAEARAKAPPPTPAKPKLLYMHEGLDLLGNIGTPVHAAADGTVTLARLDRGYGNAIHLEHSHKLGTIYGHLSGFAPGIVPGAEVKRGDVIGFVGSTGRSTGAHLHFELLVAGRPVDPSSGTQAVKLSALDSARFKRQLAFEQSLRTDERKNDRAPQRPPAMVATGSPGTTTVQ
jgi:hypothetical protein